MTVFDDILSAGFGAMVPGGGFDVKAGLVVPLAGLDYPLTQADAATALTLTTGPTALYRGDEAAGVTDLGPGGDNLTSSGTPTHETEDPELETCVAFDDNSTDALVAANNGVHEVTTGSFAYAGIATFTAPSSGFRNIVSKRAASGEGFETYLDSGNAIWFFCKDDVAATDVEFCLNCYDDGDKVVFSFWRDVANDEVKIIVDSDKGTTESTGGTVGASGSLTNTDIWAIGRLQRNSFAGNWAWLGGWFGAPAEQAIVLADLAALRTYVGI